MVNKYGPSRLLCRLLGDTNASQARAAIVGRNYVIPDDVKHMARPVLSQRMIATRQARMHGRGMEQIVDDVLHIVSVPDRRRRDLEKIGSGP
jgi:MoxR-like ATPase